MIEMKREERKRTKGRARRQNAQRLNRATGITIVTMILIWLVNFGMIVDGFMVSNLNSKRFVIRSGQYKIAGAIKESRANEMNVMEMQTHISMQEAMDRWNVTESDTGANELQMQEAMDRCNVTETGTGATELQVQEATDCWNVTENGTGATELNIQHVMDMRSESKNGLSGWIAEHANWKAES